MAVPKEGESVSYARTFTVEDVHAFAHVSLDRGVHHVKADQEGRLLVHGLLTATIPTKLGGDLDYLAQEMTYRFHRPVFTGDEILCECRASRVEERLDRTYVEFEIRCTNQHGKEVLTGSTKGVILKS
jgi:acyl dehydratase